MPPTHAPYWHTALLLIGLIGVAAGSAIIWSDRSRGRWGFLGLGLSFLYLGRENDLVNDVAVGRDSQPVPEES